MYQRLSHSKFVGNLDGYDFTALDGRKISPDVSWLEKSRLEDIEKETNHTYHSFGLPSGLRIGYRVTANEQSALATA